MQDSASLPIFGEADCRQLTLKAFKYMVAELQYKAVKVWYEKGKICVMLSDGREVRFPEALNKKLCNASVDKIKNVELICDGTGLHWPDIDEDLSVIGLMEGRFGVNH